MFKDGNDKFRKIKAIFDLNAHYFGLNPVVSNEALWDMTKDLLTNNEK